MQRFMVTLAAMAMLVTACGDSGGTTSRPVVDTTVLSTGTSDIGGGNLVMAADGGTVRSDDGMVTLDVPAGALSDDTEIIISKAAGADTGGAIVFGDVYDLQPSGLRLARPATIERVIDDPGAATRTGAPVVVLSVQNEDGTWEPLADMSIRASGSTLTVTGKVSHFSQQAATQAKNPATGNGIALVQGGTTTGIDQGDFLGFDYHFLDIDGGTDQRRASAFTDGDLTQFQVDEMPLGEALPDLLVDVIGYKPVASGPNTYFGRCTQPGTITIPGFSIGTDLGLNLPDPAVPDFFIDGLGGAHDFKAGYEFEDISSEQTIDCGPTGPPPGSQFPFDVDYTAEAPNCGTGFFAEFLAVFGPPEGFDGQLFFRQELAGGNATGRPFQLTDNNEIIIDRFEFPVPGTDSVFESFFFDLDNGTGTLTSEFGDDSCDFNAIFDPDPLGAIDEIIVADPPETETQEDCTPGDTTLCLNNGRFSVEVEWRDFAESGPANVSQLDPTTGLFFFFDDKDLNALARIVNGCQFNSHFWVFAAATTDVEFTLTVTDTAAGETKQYTNPLGQPADAITDTSAFATCP